MVDPANRYAAWRAPQEDGAILLWPEPAAFLDDARANNRLLRSAAAARVQNLPLADLRRQMRTFLGIDGDDQLTFATGHQAELHHPGVWAKNVLIDAAATTTGGTAFHVAVDTDAPKHLALRFPGYSQPFTDDPTAASADWAQLAAPPTPAHLARLIEDVEAAARDWPFAPAIAPFFAILRRLSLEAEHLPGALAAALHEYDWELGLRYTVLLASPLWRSVPYLAFVHHVLARADRFAADYNAALRSYRRRHGIKTPGRPMPELAAKDERCETPFWRDDQTRGRRIRAWVERRGDRWALAAGDDAVDLDPADPAEVAADRLLAFCRRHNLRLAPRALTLTMCLRLLAFDQFVHGIGGGQYDQVADEVIARHFAVDPPRFAVTTASLYWPTAAGRPRTSVPAIVQEGHRLRHALLGDAKRPLVAAIAGAPRHGVRRQELFQEMHRRLDAAAAGNPQIAAWEQALREAPSRVVEERQVFDRELFYPLQPRERLQRVIEGYGARFG